MRCALLTRRLLAAATAVSALVGCQFIPGSSAAIEREARAGLVTTLNDAASARFEGVRVVEGKTEREPKILCGLVNAKNQMGAYVGFRRFVVERGTGFAVVSPDAGAGSSDDARSYQDGFDAVYPKAKCPA